MCSPGKIPLFWANFFIKALQYYYCFYCSDKLSVLFCFWRKICQFVFPACKVFSVPCAMRVYMWFAWLIKCSSLMHPFVRASKCAYRCFTYMIITPLPFFKMITSTSYAPICHSSNAIAIKAEALKSIQNDTTNTTKQFSCSLLQNILNQFLLNIYNAFIVSVTTHTHTHTAHNWKYTYSSHIEEGKNQLNTIHRKWRIGKKI